jgi:outer membrane beta-barrel protein
VRIVGAEPGKPLVDTNQLYGYADLGVTFSPVYGKIALMSEGVIHFDGFVSGGIGATFDATPGLVHPALEVGAGTRVFLTHWLSVRAELRDYIYPQQLAGKTIFPNLLLLNIGLGIFFPLDFDYKYEAAKVNG